MKRPRAIVTDIEGTTTPIAFVHETLFPYARAALPDFLSGTPRPAHVEAALAEARRLAGDETLSDRDTVAVLLQWIDEDRKLPPLKTLQGLVWAEGYRSGQIRAPVYDDAAAALRAWYGEGIVLAVYSSGSVAAQKLLFGHSDHGDLTPLFSAWFDLETGSKLDRESYTAIAGALKLPPRDILFLSDNPGELAAAQHAGIAAVGVNRGNPPRFLLEDTFVAGSFVEIHFNQ